MAEMKKTLAAQEFKATQKSVQGDAMAGFKQSVAQTLGNVAGGVGVGYGEEKAKQQLGEGESAAEATAYVDEAFKEAPRPEAQGGYEVHYAEGDVNELPPTRRDGEQMKQDFLSTAFMSDKKIGTALKQGKISRKEANDRRMNNRKQFASNPLSAMFLSSYDNALSGGQGGAQRGAFFGQTNEEKIADKIAMERAVARDQRERDIDDIQEQSGQPREVATQRYVMMKARARKAAEIGDLNKIGAALQSDITVMYDTHSQNGFYGLVQNLDVLDGIEGGGRVEAVQGFHNEVDAHLRNMIFQIDSDRNISNDGRKALKDKWEKQAEFMKVDATDSGFRKQQMALQEQFTAEMANIKDGDILWRINNSAYYRAQYANTDGQPGAIVASIESTLKFNSPEWIAKFNGMGPEGVKVWKMINGEDLMMLSVDAKAKFFSGTEALSEDERKTIAMSMYEKNFPRESLTALGLDPEGFSQKVKNIPDLSSQTMAGNKYWNEIAKEEGGIDLIRVFLETAAHNAQNAQRAAGLNQEGYGTLPSSISITPPTKNVGRVLGVQTYGSAQWLLDTKGHKLAPKYKAEIIGVIKMAKKHPQVWEGKYESPEAYINGLFGGTLISEAEVAEEPSSYLDQFGRKGEGRRYSYTDMFGRTTTPDDDGKTKPATQEATHTDMFGQVTLPDEGE